MSGKSLSKKEAFIYARPQRKNFTALVVANDVIGKTLWDLHATFNEYVTKVLKEVFDARHGKRGEDLKKVFSDIGNKNEVMAKLDAVTKQHSEPGSRGGIQKSWYEYARKLLNGKKLLFNSDTFFPSDITSDFRYKVFEMVGQILTSHIGLVNSWKKEKHDWDIQRETWEKRNKNYFSVKKYFDDFIVEEGLLKASRERWQKYLKFLLNNGIHLVKWRNDEEQFVPLGDGLLKKYKDEPNKLIAILFKENPELGTLNALDRSGREKYERFKRRPSFTYPSGYKHPSYYSFKKTEPITYRNLDVSGGTVELQIKRDSWVPIKFRPDKRLKSLKQLKEPILIGEKPEERRRDRRELFHYLYSDVVAGRQLLAEPRGIKLVFRRDDLRPETNRHGKPYLFIAFDLFDREVKPILWSLRQGPKKRLVKLPEGLRILCVDFGQRDLAAITLSEIQKGKPVPVVFSPAYSDKDKSDYPAKAWLTDIRGLTIDTIATHERELASGLSSMYSSKKYKRRGSHIPRGKAGFEKLRTHISNTKENRYKNGAHIILSTALKNGASVIVTEWLENYRPTLEKPRRYNRRRMQWSVRAIQDFLKTQSQLYNIRVYEAPAYYTSTICYRCGSLGVRCILPTKIQWKKYYEHLDGENRRYVRDKGGNFFFCPKCKNLINADINASFNMANVYVGSWRPPQSGPKDKKSNKKARTFWSYKGKKIFKDEFFDFCNMELEKLPIPEG